MVPEPVKNAIFSVAGFAPLYTISDDLMIRRLLRRQEELIRSLDGYIVVFSPAREWSELRTAEYRPVFFLFREKTLKYEVKRCFCSSRAFPDDFSSFF